MFLEKAYYGKTQWYWFVLSLLIIFIAWQGIGAIPYTVYILIQNFNIPGGLSQEMLLPKTNLELGIFLLSFIIGFFAIFLCIVLIHQRTCSSVVTGRNKIDYKRILFGFVIWGALSVLSIASSVITSDNVIFQFDAPKFIGLLCVSLLLLPFQTSFEELFFRGYLMQWFGILFKYRWIPLLATSLCFGLMHGVNPEVKDFGFWVAMPQYILIGLILGYVTIKDDGTELALGLHMANNSILSLAVTSDSSALQTAALFKDMNPSMSYMDSVTILIAGIIFIYICNRKYHFMGNNPLIGKIEEPAVAITEGEEK